jgi:hypothetical protein
MDVLAGGPIAVGWLAVAPQVANIRCTAAGTQSNITPIEEVTPLAQMESSVGRENFYDVRVNRHFGPSS